MIFTKWFEVRLTPSREDSLEFHHEFRSALDVAISVHLEPLCRFGDLATSFPPPEVAAHLEARIKRQTLRFHGRWSGILEKVSQESLDDIVITARRLELIRVLTGDRDKARLNAAFELFSGKWLFAIPSLTIGAILDNITLRIAAGLRLGLTLCAPHACARCEAPVADTGHHGMSCSRSMG